MSLHTYRLLPEHDNNMNSNLNILSPCDHAGESANGAYPEVAVSTMAQIARNAEIGVNFYQSFDYIRTFTPKPIGTVEAVCSAIAKNAVDVRPGGSDLWHAVMDRTMSHSSLHCLPWNVFLRSSGFLPRLCTHLLIKV